MLKFITGLAGSGKTTKVLNEIINRLNDESDEQNLILFVPDQMTFQAEYEIAKKVKGKSYSRLQVFSFKRLAYRLFLEVGGFNKTFISDLTTDMMITKIIEEHRREFKIYHKLSPNYNFVSLVHEVIKEFKSYAVTEDLLKDALMDHTCDESLKQKMHDLFLIYNELIKLYDNKRIDQEDFYMELNERLNDSNYIKNTSIYIDGYHSFTGMELQIIQNLMKIAQNVTMLFTLPNLNENAKLEDTIFQLPYRTMKKLLDFASEEHLKIHIEYLEKAVRFKHSELAFIANHFHTSKQYNNDVQALEIIETENPTSEVYQVARLIYNDIYTNKATYSDYVIYINNQEVYVPLIQNIFRLYGIPVFIDEKKSMLDHFLLNFLDAALEVAKTNFRHEAIFRAIKTELFLPLTEYDEKLTEKNYDTKINNYRKRIDLLENYCLSHGIKGSMWSDPHWDYDKNKKIMDFKRVKTKEEEELERIINQTKNEITEPMMKFVHDFKQGKTVLDKIKVMYELLIDLEVERKLDLFEKIDSLNDDLNQAKRHKQVYNKIIELFDELASVCQDYVMETDEFIKILQTGFKGLRFAIVPPALDQVMVGTLKRSRFEMMGHFDDAKSMGVKKAFILGVNENEIPKIETDSGLITNKERQFLIEHDIDLVPTIEQAFMDDYFIIYTAIASPSEKLILSYTLSNYDKKETIRSEIIDQVLQMYPKLNVKTIYDFPGDEINQLDYVTSLYPTTSLLLSAIGRLRQGYSVNEMWKALYGYFNHSKDYKHKLAGVTYKNEAVSLSQDDIKKCFNDEINASVSSIEKYNSCPYQYFMDKGLNVKERDIQTVEAMDIGDLYHETLKEISMRLIKEKKALHELPLNELHEMVLQVIKAYGDKMQRHFFDQNKRNQYLLKQVEESLLKSLDMMHYQSKHSKFQILAVEEPFGAHAKHLQIEPIPLSNGMKMNLKGFIDRIDVAYLDEKDPYIRIIDYKSGNKDIDFTKIYHKLSLQLFTYLDVVLKNSEKLLEKDAIAAGVLYYHIHNSEINAPKDPTSSEIEKLHKEAYKMNGYSLSESNVSLLFDDKLGDSGKSDVVKVTFSKDGYNKSQSRVLDEETIDAIRQYTRKAIIDSSEEIIKGNIAIKPVRYNNVATCTYCNYKSICKFDPQLKENAYNTIHKVGDKTEILELIKAEMEGETNE